MFAQKKNSSLIKWLGLGLLILPTILLGLDATILYLVLPSIVADLQPSATQTLWIMDAYGFFIAGFLITMGTLGDRIGRRRLLKVGLVGFAVVSIFAALAQSAEMLIIARSLLGVAGATLMPSTLSLIHNIFTDAKERAMAIGVWVTMFALGMAAGPIVGGVLIEHFWWGSAFLLAIPVAALVLLYANKLLPEYKSPQSHSIDYPSVALSLATILPVIYAVKNLAAYGISLYTLLFVLIGLTAGVFFVIRQRRLTTPLLDVSLFANRAFSAALFILLTGLIGVGGTMYLVTQYLQIVQEFSPIVAGLWMGPPAVAMLVSGIVAPIIARKVRPGIVMGATLAAPVIGYTLLALAGTESAIPVIVGFTFVYLGLGAIAALGTDMIIGAAPASKSGSAAAVSETAQELGVAVGVALLGSLTVAIYRTQISNSLFSQQITERLAENPTEVLGITNELAPGALVVIQQAFTTGMNSASIIAGVAIAIASLLCFTTLRHTRPLDDH